MNDRTCLITRLSIASYLMQPVIQLGEYTLEIFTYLFYPCRSKDSSISKLWSQMYVNWISCTKGQPPCVERSYGMSLPYCISLSFFHVCFTWHMPFSKNICKSYELVKYDSFSRIIIVCCGLVRFIYD